MSPLYHLTSIREKHAVELDVIDLLKSDESELSETDILKVFLSIGTNRISALHYKSY